MKKKIFLLFMTIFLLSGCTASYSVNINEDNSVTEEASVYEEKEIFDYYFIDALEHTSYTPEYFSDISIKNYISQWSKNYNITGYARSDSEKNYSVKKDSNYSSLNELKNSQVLKMVFDKVEIKNNDNIWSLNFSGYNKEVLNVIDNYNVTIKLPYLILDTNGSKNSLNIVTWNFNKLNVDDIFLEFDISKKYDEIESVAKKEKNKPDYKTYLIIGVCIVSVGLIGFVIFRTAYKLNDEV